MLCQITNNIYVTLCVQQLGKSSQQRHTSLVLVLSDSYCIVSVPAWSYVTTMRQITWYSLGLKFQNIVYNFQIDLCFGYWTFLKLVAEWTFPFVTLSLFSSVIYDFGRWSWLNKSVFVLAFVLTTQEQKLRAGARMRTNERKERCVVYMLKQ